MRQAGWLLTALCAASFSVSQAQAEAVSQQSFTLPMGPHVVGFQPRQEVDSSRVYWSGSHSPPDAQFRPMHVHVWYPATRGGSPVRYGDYVSLYGADEGVALKDVSRQAVLAQLGRDWDLPSAPPDSELQAATPAWRDAPPAPGRFPLIVYAPAMGGVAWENSVLCEYLASHGYVVIAVPSHGERSATMTADVAGVGAQVRDIEWLIGYAASLPFVDRSQLALMGWSWGGLAAALVKTRRDDIRAIVELDGSIAYEEHYKKTFSAFAGADERRVDVPLIFLQQATLAGHAPLPDLAPEQKGYPPVFFQRLQYSDALWIRMGQMMHEEFSSAGHRISRPPMLEAARKQASYAGDFWWHEIPAASRGYEIVASYALQFLEAHVRQSAAARAWLAAAPATHGFLDTEVVALVRRQPVGPAPGVAAFASQVKPLTFESLLRAYQLRLQADMGYRLPSQELLAWADALARGSRFEEALAVLRLDAAIQVDEVGSLLRVAGMAVLAGRRDLAVATLKGILERNPTHVEAAGQLEKLKP